MYIHVDLSRYHKKEEKQIMRPPPTFQQQNRCKIRFKIQNLTKAVEIWTANKGRKGLTGMGVSQNRTGGGR